MKTTSFSIDEETLQHLKIISQYHSTSQGTVLRILIEREWLRLSEKYGKWQEATWKEVNNSSAKVEEMEESNGQNAEG
tara:strand:- start:1542 stop:1775 length:234 start_codon:yes stop_codon:yes gene_type:complete